MQTTVMEQPRVRVLSQEDVEEQRRIIIQSVGGNYDDFRRRAELYLLDARETMLYEELKGLDFLLHG